MQYVQYVGATLMFWNSYAEKKETVLDPMLTVVRLALLAFQPVGTKIGMTLVGFDLQPPGVSQGLYRTFTFQGHDDLGVFGETIKKAVFQYKAKDKTEMHAAIKIIFEAAIEGLKNLQKTYPNTTTSEAISNWINILNGQVKVEPDPTITPIAKSVKERWRLDQLQDFSKWFQEAKVFDEQMATSPEASKKLAFTIEKIKMLSCLKQIEFEEVLCFSQSI